MKKLSLIFLCALPLLATSQTLLYNDGAIIKVQPGATLYVEGGIHNTASGTIDNDGTIEVQGNFLNQGTWENSQPNTLRFSGTGLSQVTPGSAIFDDVDITKNGNQVELLDNMTIAGDLTFNAGASGSRIRLGNNNLILTAASTISGYDNNEYVETNGTGVIQKTVTANGAFLFPVGDAINYSPLNAAYTGTAYSSANLRVRTVNAAHPNKPADATDFIGRYWRVESTGITNYSNTMTGTYAAADLTGSAAMVKGAVYDYNGAPADWYYFDAANSGNTVTGSTTDATVDFTGTNFFGKAMLKVFLAGALPGTGIPPMSTTLSTNGAIPMASPYSASPWNAPAVNASSIPANTTDWILVEARDPSINIISQTSAFLLSDGTIVNVDGSSPLRMKDAAPNAIISIRHRNHLGIRTSTEQNLLSPSLHDFSTGTDKAYTNNSVPPIPTNDNMRLIGSTYALWAGNAGIANANAQTRINFAGPQNDNAALLSALGGNSAGTLGVPANNLYHQADLNLNGNVRYAGPQNDNAVLIQNLGGNTATTIIQHL